MQHPCQLMQHALHYDPKMFPEARFIAQLLIKRFDKLSVLKINQSEANSISWWHYGPLVVQFQNMLIEYLAESNARRSNPMF